MGYGQERLKDIVGKKAEEEEEEEEEKPAAAKEEEEAKEQRQGPTACKEQQQDDDDDDDDERNDTVTKIKLAYEGKRVKTFRVTGNLNNSNTKMIRASITPHAEMRVKVIYSFKSVISRGAGEVKPYSKTLDSSPGMFTSLKEIQAFIK